MQTSHTRTPAPVAEVALRGGIVSLTLATAIIHLTLAGTLFTLNAAGYAILALAMAAPLNRLASIRWLTRIALAGYTAVTVVGWYLVGPRYDTAYVAKGIELVLITLLVVESYHSDGSPAQVARRLARVAGRFVTGRGTRPSGAA